jgi:esterase/lipase superfamily enzyme
MSGLHGWVVALIGRFHILTAVAIASAICCCGCSGRLSQGALLPVALANTEGTSRVPVLVATKRKRSSADAGEMFDSERADEVSYASVTVSIPPDATRKIGEVQWPTSPPGDAQQNFITVSANYLGKKSFAAALSTAAKQTGRGKVLVFVHGFNNRFDEAVYRFAQIVHDSKAPAIPVLFSWPSRGVVGLRAYQDDLESASDSRDAVGQLLDTIAVNANVREVTVLCHSMGCSLTLEALRSRAIRAGKIGDKVKNVLLVAPDVDVNLFRTQIQQMGSDRPRFALFLSQDDHALKLSKSIGGGITRLGDVDPDQEPYKSEFQREGILVFDLTGLRGGAHSRAFEKVTSVMGMIEQRLAEGQQMTNDGSKPQAAIE